jgi:hypothetical protein
MFSPNGSRFLLVLAAAFSAMTSATMLRGNLPITTASGNPVESLNDAKSRMLVHLDPYDNADLDKGLAAQGGVGTTFTRPSSSVKSGNVCGQTFFTGDVVFQGIGDYELDNGEAYEGGCPPSDLIGLRTNAMNKTAAPIDGALGGKTFTAGTFYTASSLTVAANTNVTLRGGSNDIFLFQSGSYMITGENAHFILEADPDGANATDVPQAKNILVVLAGYATTGFESTFEGSILAGAAITHGAGSVVSGYVRATAALTVGADCTLNSALILPNTGNLMAGDRVVASPIQTLINTATCHNGDDADTGDPIFIAQVYDGSEGWVCPSNC